jgi:ubiquinone/menaquinone biosynthesis C-methylase UbiE
MKVLLRLFFHLLYHQFAFTYDLIAAAVSFGRWKDWVLSVIPFIEGKRILEIGQGPGHLQRVLLSRGLVAFAIDESAPMIRLAKRNIARKVPESSDPASPLHQRAYAQANITRGLAQHLPFANNSFDTIVSTFPSEYIFDARTLLEARRVLRRGGRFIVLPVALPKNPFLDWLFRVTGESPSEAIDIVKSKLRIPFADADFETEIQTLDVETGTLLVILAGRKEEDHVEEAT